MNDLARPPARPSQAQIGRTTRRRLNPAGARIRQQEKAPVRVRRAALVCVAMVGLCWLYRMISGILDDEIAGMMVALILVVVAIIWAAPLLSAPRRRR